MLAHQIVEMWIDNTATLGMTLFAIKQNGTLSREIRQDALRCGAALWDFLGLAASFNENDPITGTWHEIEERLAFGIISTAQDRRSIVTLRELTATGAQMAKTLREVEAAQDNLEARLEPAQLDAAMAFCHNLYMVLVRTRL